ncbi:MAG: DEAD/DEAH box helicase [Arcobacter sp.]|nr:DEAD/DEAH box helicase [Arcobacter sp.]
MLFNELKLSNALLSTISKYGYKETTKIQEKVIPLVLEKKDLIARAQTGSGKTASFVLPILNLWGKQKVEGKAKVKVLVLTPTRELTLQVAKTFEVFAKQISKKLKVVSLIGGDNLGNQMLQVQKGCDVVVATPGRLIDIINKKQIDLKSLDFFVLDEADKMLDLGFEEELQVILDAIPKKRQNLFFSATYPNKMSTIALKITNNPLEVFIEDEEQIVENINQRAIRVNLENRSALLKDLIKNSKWDKILVFMATKRSSDNIAAKFRKHGFNAESFHGNLDQDERKFTIEDFKNKEIDILFSTDIAARGLDIDDISCVINYDLPRSTNDYVHRIGRTARAGKRGTAISFLTHENLEHFKLIEKKCNIKLTYEEIEGFELIGDELKKEKGQAAIKGKRKSKKDKLREKNLKTK